MLGDDARYGVVIYIYISVVDCVIAMCYLLYRPMYTFGHMCTQVKVAPDGPERN